MCCFSQPVLSVSKTQIFARLTGTGTQFLVYQMDFESEVPNAMILPIPVAKTRGEDSVRFIDLSSYSEFFDHLDAAFPYQARGGFGCSSEGEVGFASADSLIVHEVGDFVASFVPSVNDFDRLDPQFVIPKNTWLQIPEYADYGFVVFQLNSLAGRPHPMAFEFETRSEGVFFPTVHIHDGQLHEEEEFDHTLYLQHAGYDCIVDAYVNYDIPDPATSLVRSKLTAGQVCDIGKSGEVVQANLLLHRSRLSGKMENKDFNFDVTGSPNKLGFNLRHWRRWLVPATLLSLTIWFFRRRHRLLRLTRGDGNVE